jgi:hypothetical protein
VSEQSEKPEGKSQRQIVGDGAHPKIPGAVPSPTDDIHGGSHPKVPLPTPTGEDKPKK